ncbi:hypothetical protein K2173_002695 [Erythroxylum novogranatense]|uniref:DNA polymerase alpha subunit B n=1 Tax=Erythroxylum novogranatense TaxID=1862640 RepID=A0AAV8SWS5_9ROSI|nr:hypothetical protein K2173_002695 [Erythroxylum novogranatense]
MEQEIKSEFNRMGFTLEEEEEILKKCLTLCINYKLEPSDLVSSWEVYYLNRQLGESVVQNGEMEGFLLHLQNEQKELLVKEEPNLHVYTSKDLDMILNYEEDDSKEGILGTPPGKSPNFSAEPASLLPNSNGDGYSSGRPTKLVTSFGRRTNRFTVKFSICNVPDADNAENELVPEGSEDEIIKSVQPPNRCSLKFHGSGPKPGCRFMYDRIEDRFNTLDNRIRKHAAALVASGLYEELVDPTVASQRNVFAVGMICCDGEGRLNEKSIILQSSVEHSGGQQVRLDLHQLNQCSIFPGQIVGIEGHNPSGHCLIASKLVDCVPLSASADVSTHPAKKQALDQQIQSDDLSKKQEVLSILGPFIDSEHPEIKKGSVDKSFDEIFYSEILNKEDIPLEKNNGIRNANNREFKDVPQHLWTENFALVASQSIPALSIVKMCSKPFLEAISKSYVFEHATPKKFSVLFKNIGGASSFFKQRKDSENPEALFLQGLKDFFDGLITESGLELLSKAADKGHSGAKYMHDIILACHGDRHKEERLKLHHS